MEERGQTASSGRLWLAEVEWAWKQWSRRGRRMWELPVGTTRSSGKRLHVCEGHRARRFAALWRDLFYTGLGTFLDVFVSYWTVLVFHKRYNLVWREQNGAFCRWCSSGMVLKTLGPDCQGAHSVPPSWWCGQSVTPLQFSILTVTWEQQTMLMTTPLAISQLWGRCLGHCVHVERLSPFRGCCGMNDINMKP